MENNNTLKQIIEMKNEFDKVSKRYKEDIECLEWQYLKEVYGLNKFCVCSIKGRDGYFLLSGISYFFKDMIALQFKKIKSDGNVSLRGAECSINHVLKEFESYADYKRALNNL